MEMRILFIEVFGTSYWRVMLGGTVIGTLYGEMSARGAYEEAYRRVRIQASTGCTWAQTTMAGNYMKYIAKPRETKYWKDRAFKMLDEMAEYGSSLEVLRNNLSACRQFILSRDMAMLENGTAKTVGAVWGERISQ